LLPLCPGGVQLVTDRHQLIQLRDNPMLFEQWRDRNEKFHEGTPRHTADD
jgi:hypothetical protein